MSTYTSQNFPVLNFPHFRIHIFVLHKELCSDFSAVSFFIMYLNPSDLYMPDIYSVNGKIKYYKT